MADNTITKQDLLDLEARIAELVTTGFETMNGRFDRLEIQLDELEKRLGKVEVRIDGMEARFSGINVPLRMLEGSHRETNDWIGRVDGRLQAVENDIKEIYDFIAEIRGLFAGQLKKQPEQEKRLEELEALAESIGRRVGLKLS